MSPAIRKPSGEEISLAEYVADMPAESRVAREYAAWDAALADINHRWVEREGLLLDAQLKLAGEQAECREIMVMADRILDALASDHQGGPPCAAGCESCNLVAEMAVALSRVPGSTEALEVMIERACELAREADYDGHCFTPEQIVSRILGDERKGDAR